MPVYASPVCLPLHTLFTPAACQVPLALIGLLAFNVAWSLPNLLSILVGTLAGVVFAVAKSKN